MLKIVIFTLQDAKFHCKINYSHSWEQIKRCNDANFLLFRSPKRCTYYWMKFVLEERKKGVNGAFKYIKPTLGLKVGNDRNEEER